jgi:E3 ubiquitin-protein ligase SIAH1
MFRHRNKSSLSDSSSDLSLSAASLLEWLECPVCLDVQRSPPISACRNGHIICSSCHPKLSLCPQCRSDDLGCRNIVAEKLLAAALKVLVLPCTNKAAGCNWTDKSKDLTEHEFRCIYRTMECPANQLGACSWKGPMKNLMHHFLEKGCVNVCPQFFDQRTQINIK